MPAHSNLRTLDQVHQYSAQEHYHSLYNICKNVPAMACCPNSNDPKINWFFFPGLYRSNTKIKCSSAYISKFFRCPAFVLFTTMCFSSI